MSMQNPGQSAVEKKGWLAAHKWLVLRRLSQALVVFVFLVGPLTGFWLVKGTLASSITLDVLPLTDPFIFLQSLMSGHVMETSAIIGVGIVLLGYFLVGGRTFCSFVCPINVISDTATWLRRKLGWKKTGIRLNRGTALWIMGGVLLTSAVTGTIAWEFLNPVTILHRSLVFGSFGTVFLVTLLLFLIELVGGENIWCSRICPVGAFYGLIGKVSLIKISANNRKACNDCMDCYTVCPESHVISPALKGEKDDQGPIILSGDCTNCGRCLDVCSEDVFKFSLRTKNKLDDVRPHKESAKDSTTRAA
ncbi:ferredoxin-type protein essential for electron transfer from ubiquinol to periplasmic nitrate reductase (NapAB) [Candidatus Terasakiella magnetica]|uniref:Ferredoxin-type protein essential for electron transfer from ubiquinol to periplasmic nitrate reductase (NapAB) n=1 Tax=Candidatus Terasakiella magnetica TaxID=1867952 RepID=A0A1C3RJ53_9PROT|nr:quinol dehydrogenase ferredoxin subunit NapH [Candidatus Terasakiella magnetica]SCA57289.1 ferredoxin-type protein essential for electron transfer from ubiquinol to periplasmic nitrate reductase (NapAB) [Candidatus Terasakiella magnetica]